MSDYEDMFQAGLPWLFAVGVFAVATAVGAGIVIGKYLM